MSNIECAFSGRLGGDPEQRTSKAGNQWCRFNVAVGEGDDTQWVSVSCFKDAAQRALERLHKGDRAYFEGSIKLNKWAAQDGTERSGLQAACFKVEPLGQIGRRKPPKAKAAAAEANGEQAPPPETERRDRFDNNIPF